MRFTLGCNHPSFTLPWRTLLPYLVALHHLQPGSAQNRVVAPSLRVTAMVGQDVVLRCQLSPCKDARNSDIRWIQQRSSGIVHHYQDGVDLEQMTEYKGRTELLRKGLSDGNLDLHITAVSSSDRGSYICIVQDDDGYSEAVVNLEVSDPFSQIIHPWKVALAVVIIPLAGSFVINVFLYRKRAAQSRELKRKDAALEEKAAMLGRKDAMLKKLTAMWDLSAANLKAQATILVERTGELEIRNSLLKRHLRKMEYSAVILKQHIVEGDISAENLKEQATKLVEQTKESVVESEESEIQNSLLKEHCERMELSLADLKKLAARLEEEAE
ncbi:erythroid membrane-associated protein isoform X1 [Gallus gallus]|nr:erythroid membrane-associated protein isoform X1 [Gallus gallus]XP_040504661.1 erythroid membrane-associated protein isoform X1 [Gallus gallus]